MNLGGALIIGDRPLADYLSDLTCKLPSADDRERLTQCLASYNSGVGLNSDDFSFVMDKAKEIGLSF